MLLYAVIACTQLLGIDLCRTVLQNKVRVYVLFF